MNLSNRIRAAWALLRGMPGALYMPSGGGGATGLADTQGNVREMIRAYQGWVYKCVRRRSEDVSSARLRLQYENEDEDYEDAPPGHPLRALLRKPNPFESGSFFRARANTFLDMTGNCYILKIRNALRMPAELWILDPTYIRVIPDSERIIRGYRYEAPGGTTVTIDAADIIHVKHPNPASFYYGASPLMAAAYEYDIDMGMKRHQKEFFDNWGAPRIAISHDGYMTQQAVEHLRMQLQERVGGSRNAGRPLVLQQGAKVSTISLTPAELDYLNSRKNARDEILTVYGVPASILGVAEDVNRANAEANHFTFAMYTLEPLAQRWDDALTMGLAQEFDTELVVRHVSLVPEDREANLRESTELTRAGITSINEERESRGWDPVPGGEEPLVGLNLVPLSQIAEDPLASAPRSSVTDAVVERGSSKRAAYWRRVAALHRVHERRMTRSMQRYFQAQREAVIAAFDAEAGRKSLHRGIDVELVLPDPDTWNRVIEEVSFEDIKPAFASAWDFAMADIGADHMFDIDDLDLRRVMRESLQKIKGVNQTTVEALRASLAEGLAGNETNDQLRDRVLDVYDEAGNVRAMAIATTTATQSVNAGMDQAWQAEDDLVTGKTWITARDNAVRHTHQAMDGVTVALRTPFEVPRKQGGLDMMDYPGDPAGSAENVINCRCFQAPQVKK